ncbi:MAG: carboxylating nicotinate-nucleotide diphosphorylase [Theionarchaea archaeon]|nr:carboxylating nicotinate-nucleotide diphosphorylase [Theionarchaea archaeon]
MIDLYAEHQLKNLLMEDTGFGDITSKLLGDMKGSASIIVKEDCILSGLQYVKYLFELRGLEVNLLAENGNKALKGTQIVVISGSYQRIFEVERTALNLLTRMSGIATETRNLVERVRDVNSHCRVAATRKTSLRFFDKEAVVTGGGDSHRFRLDDMILLKDNHIRILGIKEAVSQAKKVSFSKKVEVEVSTKEDAVTAVECGADVVMLDNMTPGNVEEAVAHIRKVNPHTLIEVSGEVSKDNIRRYAQTGADIISLGYITHSIKVVNMSLEVDV